MNPLLIAPLFEFGSKIIDRLFPDQQQKAAAELELLKMTQEGDLKVVLAQLEVNAKEAQHASIFVAGWRPFVGWTCGIGMVYQTVLHNILQWLSVMNGWPPLPAPDTETLIYVLFAMLGVAGLRTYEKKTGVSK